MTDTLLSLRRVLVLLCVLWQIALCAVAMRRSLHGGVDFRAFYTAGRSIAAGHGAMIYDYDATAEAERAWVSADDRVLPYLYPAFGALLFVPFAAVGYKCAFVAFTVANIGLLTIVARWFAHRSGSGSEWHVWVPFCFLPVAVALVQGQISVMLLAIFVGMHCSFERGRFFSAGLLLSLALIKFQLAMPVFAVMLLWRCWRLIAGFGVGAVSVGLVSLHVAGRAGMLEYVRSTMEMAGKIASDPAAAKDKYGMFPADMPNLQGAAFALMHGGLPSLLLLGVASAGLLWWVGRQRPGVPVALTAALLVSYHLEIYDLTLLLLPLSVIVGESSRAVVRYNAMQRSAVGVWMLVAGLATPVAVLPMAAGCSWIYGAASVMVLRMLSRSRESSPVLVPVRAAAT